MEFVCVSSLSILIFRSGFLSSISTSVVGVFVGPCPFFGCCLSGLLSDETQIWLGDLRVVFCGAGCCVVLLCGLLLWYMTTVSCTFLTFLYASLSVRTEP